MNRTSQILASALKLKPMGTVHSAGDCLCSLCGGAIRDGDISADMDLPTSFVDFNKLIPSEFVCGLCRTMISASEEGEVLLKNIQRAVITPEGIFNLNTDAARAWLWLTPPKPPFAVVINHTVMAAFHYPWRTPVTLHPDFIQINVDDKVMSVNRREVLEALEMSKYLLGEFNRGVLRSPRTSPFVVLLREPKTGHGQLAPDVLQFVRSSSNARLHECVSFLSNLGRGELFALSSLIKKDQITVPEKPNCLRGLSQIAVMKLDSKVSKLNDSILELRGLVVSVRSSGDTSTRSKLMARSKAMAVEIEKLEKEKRSWAITDAKDLLKARSQFKDALAGASALVTTIFLTLQSKRESACLQHNPTHLPRANTSLRSIYKPFRL